MRRLPSDAWVSLSHGKWRYYRWLSWVMSAISAIMAVGMTGILLSFAGAPHLDRAALTLGALCIAGSTAVGLAAFRAYKWLGRREPPDPRADAG